MQFGRFILKSILVVGLCAVVPNKLWAASICGPDGVQASGAVYRICMPDQDDWNGNLILYANGYVAFNNPVEIQEDHLKLTNGQSITEIANNAGYAFATTSYSINGLAVRQGLEDLRDLVDIFNQTYPKPRYVYLVGTSQGGLIVALALEQFPDIFDGVLAACGIVGDFSQQINYWTDFRVVFDYFFPKVIPGSPVHIPIGVIDDWDTVYVPRIKKAVRANQRATREVLRVTRVPIDRPVPSLIENTVVDLLWFNIFFTNDAEEKLGGQAFNNMDRYYYGSSQDQELNRNIRRFSSDQAALDEIKAHYQTSGCLTAPLVTLHSIKDPIVPYWQESLYQIKVALSGSSQFHNNIPAFCFGHCNYRADELLRAFALLVAKVEGRERLISITQ